MLINDVRQLIQYSHYQDLLREAEQERRVRAAFPQRQGHLVLRRVAARGLRDVAHLALHVSNALNPQVEPYVEQEAAGLR